MNPLSNEQAAELRKVNRVYRLICEIFDLLYVVPDENRDWGERWCRYKIQLFRETQLVTSTEFGVEFFAELKTRVESGKVEDLLWDESADGKRAKKGEYSQNIAKIIEKARKR